MHKPADDFDKKGLNENESLIKKNIGSDGKKANFRQSRLTNNLTNDMTAIEKDLDTSTLSKSNKKNKDRTLFDDEENPDYTNHISTLHGTAEK